MFIFLNLISSCKNDDNAGANSNIERFSAEHFQQIEDLKGAFSSVSSTMDGGFILTGEATSRNVPLIKLASDCSFEWKKEFGGSENDRGNEVKQISDGKYIIGGATASFGVGSFDGYLLQANPIGGEIWSRTFGDVDADQIESIVETSDGGFIAVGYTGIGFDYNLSILKTDNNGELTDTLVVNRTFDDKGYKIVDAGNNEFGVLGVSRNVDVSGQLLIMKINENLDTIWTKTIDNVEYFTLHSSMIATNDGGFLAIANTIGISNEGDLNLLLIKLDAEGQVEWRQEYDGDIEEFAQDAIQTSDKGYMVISATSNLGNGELDFMLTKVDELGNEVWSKTYGGARSDGPNDIIKINDGYLICGSSRSISDDGEPAMVILKVDEEGMPQ